MKKPILRPTEACQSRKFGFFISTPPSTTFKNQNCPTFWRANLLNYKAYFTWKTESFAASDVQEEDASKVRKMFKEIGFHYRQ